MGLLASVAPTAARAEPAGCTLRIVRFAWVPDRIYGGDSSTAWVAAENCTGQTLELTRTVYGEQIPPCPTIDPLAAPVTIEPHGRYVAKALRLVAPDCTGVEVLVVAFAGADGTILASATATLHIRTPRAGPSEVPG
jgi:hypothetical protein